MSDPKELSLSHRETVAFLRMRGHSVEFKESLTRWYCVIDRKYQGRSEKAPGFALNGACNALFAEEGR
jgi:hypothetical protein